MSFLYRTRLCFVLPSLLLTFLLATEANAQVRIEQTSSESSDQDATQEDSGETVRRTTP